MKCEDFSNYNIGLGITGSFCTFAKTRKEIQRLCDMGANVVPVFSFNAQTCDTRFGSAKDYVDGICEITGNEGIRTICAAEPIGPNNFLDIMVIAPCTGNTAAKLCNGITDTPGDGDQSAYAQRGCDCHLDERCARRQL
ncbi:flavoprotein [Clostridium fessum]|uniref:flavoprotein n=1 Tax=Clostridium fessum TaxID=2126740 RepID=UPI00399A7C9E